jgi:hypothetical protein
MIVEADPPARTTTRKLKMSFERKEWKDIQPDFLSFCHMELF